MTCPSEICIYWAAQKVGHQPASLADTTNKMPEIVFGRQLAMMAMAYAGVPNKIIAFALNLRSPASAGVLRYRIMGRSHSCLFRQAAALGKSLRNPSQTRKNSQKQQNSAGGPSSRSPTCQTGRPNG